MNRTAHKYHFKRSSRTLKYDELPRASEEDIIAYRNSKNSKVSVALKYVRNKTMRLANLWIE